jgi:hypothetical protein
MVLVGSVLEALVWSFLHDMPAWVIAAIAVLGFIGFLAFARWIGNRRMFCGLWILFVSLGFMTGLILFGLLPRFPYVGLVGLVTMFACWHPLKRAEDRTKAIESTQRTS